MKKGTSMKKGIFMKKRTFTKKGSFVKETASQKETASLKETFSLNYRAFRLIGERCPKVWLSALLSSAMLSATPYVGIWISARLLNELAGERDPQRLWNLVLAALSSGALLALLNGVLSRWKNYCRAPLWDQIQKIYRDKMLDMDFQSMDDQRTHELFSRIEQLQTWNGWGLTKVYRHYEGLIRCLTGIIGAAALTGSLFTLQVPETAGKLTLMNHPLTILGVVALLAAVTFLAPVCNAKADQCIARQASQNMEGNRIFFFYGQMAISDRMRAMDIRMYNQQEVCHWYLFSGIEHFRPGGAIARAAAGHIGLLNAAGGALSMLFIGIIYLFTCLKAWAGAFGVGSVTQYVGSITAFSRNISTLLQTAGEMRSNAIFLRTAFAFLDIPNSMYQGSLTTEKRSDRKYQVEFRDVSFQYPGTDTYVLRHVSMKFHVGQKLAIVGQNGSGKTTFIKLLCRLYDPTEGEILLNGINIKKYRYDDYMSIFSVVFQDFQLLALPLGQNIAVCQNYDKELTRECLEKAGFADRLAGMKKGMDTSLYRDLDAEGVEVSGGEAQKLAIARALYKGAPFVILDEPTAALDPMAEMEIYQKFDQITGDKTAVYISHRLSSCRFCDEIAVFDQGRLVQQGSHDTLLAEESGKYAELWNAQAQYYQ